MGWVRSRVGNLLRKSPALVRLVRRTKDRWTRYALADKYLGGLKGIEIGGSAQNPFKLDTLNVDIDGSMNSAFKREEVEQVGWALPVDVIAPGDDLPFPDKSHDFVLASHVIEHFRDPIGALAEWDRVARRYIFVIVPHPDRTFDKGRPLTPVEELFERHLDADREKGESELEVRHQSVWTCETFVEMCGRIGLRVVATEDPDRKRGNGFGVVIETQPDARTASVPSRSSPA